MLYGGPEFFSSPHAVPGEASPFEKTDYLCSTGLSSCRYGIAAVSDTNGDGRDELVVGALDEPGGVRVILDSLRTAEWVSPISGDLRRAQTGRLARPRRSETW